MNKNNKPEHSQQIAAFHQEMLRFARLQLRDQSLSEEVTQEAITTALERNNCRAGGELHSWVLVHRTRMRLRNLETSFIQQGNRMMNCNWTLFARRYGS